MYHNFGNPKTIKFFKKELIFQEYSALRHYYIYRNHTYLETRFAQKFYKLSSSYKRVKYLVFIIIKILLYDNQEQWLKIRACLLGTFHGFIGKLGKVWS
jgi:rhamnosyltransferase